MRQASSVNMRLDVQIVFVEGGSSAVQTLISVDVAFAQMAGAAPLQSNLKSSDVVMIAGAGAAGSEIF